MTGHDTASAAVAPTLYDAFFFNSFFSPFPSWFEAFVDEIIFATVSSIQQLQ